MDAEKPNEPEQPPTNQKAISTNKGRFFMNKKQGEINSGSSTSGQQQTGQDQECSHPIIIKDMCCNCGKDLRAKGGFSGERIVNTDASISMIHHVPELVVSNEVANELGARDHENILRQRKLILLVDLDQTLVHTSNKPPKPNEIGSSNMFGYQLFGSTFFTKIRPYTQHFLDRINKLYEMHIVTYGQRRYAHKIAELLDPSKKYFDYRILSRDELLSSMHKCGNLKALFPCSEQLIVMLDDRPDVWMHSESLIRVKPYRFFTEVGDINAPPQEVENEMNKKAPAAPENGKKEKPEKIDSTKPLEEEAKDADDAEKMVEVEVQPMNEDEKSKSAEKSSTKVDELCQPIPPIPDDDNALEHIERILTEIHTLFYQQYDKEKKVPDVKRIVTWLRSQVFAGERIVFSGIVPLGVDIRACEIHRLCCQFGAKIDEKIVEGQTTVLVAAKAATEKFRVAIRLRIPIVSTRWLDACFERWKKVDKRDFLFSEEEDPNNRPILSQKRSASEEEVGALKRPRLSSESLGMNAKMDHFAQMDTLDKQALHEMEDEIASALSDEDNSSKEDEEGKEEGESSGSSLDEETIEEEVPSAKVLPLGKQWKDELAAGGERYGNNEEDEEDDQLGTARGGEFSGGEDDDEDDEENRHFDYGNENEEEEVDEGEVTRDTDFGEDESEFYDEMAADIEQQLNGRRSADEGES